MPQTARRTDIISMRPNIVADIGEAALLTVMTLLGAQDEDGISRISAKDIAAVTGRSNVTIYRALSALRQKRLITQVSQYEWEVAAEVGHRGDDK